MMLAASWYGDLNFAVGPLTGVLALGTLLLLSRFVFGTGRRKTAPPPDFGLLVPIVAMPTRAAAEVARDLLADEGIRATLAERPTERQPVRITADGRELPPEPQLNLTDLLVFPADVPQARTLLRLGA